MAAAEVRADGPVRGVATAAEADAAATVIANAVDLPGHPAVHRTPAAALQADSDLGCRRVTAVVGALTPGEAGRALDGGARVAGHLLRDGRIVAAAMHCQGVTRVAGAAVLAREAVHA